jgi:hypothetical protein
MVLQPVAAGIKATSDPSPPQLTGICLAEICLLDQKVRGVEEMFDFPWQRIKVSPPDMNGTQQENGTCSPSYSP